MPSANQPVPISNRTLWAGRITSGLVVIFLLFDASVKLLKLAPAVEGTLKLGYPESAIVPLGVVLLAAIVLYTIPRTAVLGAILITGFLGGATATQVRVQSPWFVFPVIIGGLAWLGLYLRDQALRELLPTRNTSVVG